jgi:hypothetical protein
VCNDSNYGSGLRAKSICSIYAKQQQLFVWRSTFSVYTHLLSNMHTEVIFQFSCETTQAEIMLEFAAAFLEQGIIHAVAICDGKIHDEN